MQTTSREAGLDALRAAGACLVLFAHGGYFLFPAWPGFDAYLLAGWLGTEVFFALTGFLVTREMLALRGGDLAVGARYAAWRLLRILPLFWLALFAHATLARNEVPDDAWRYVFLMQNLASSHPGFFGEAWNLPLIVLFSLFAPAVAVAFASSRRAMWLGVIVLLALGLVMRAEWIGPGAPRWDEDVRKIVLPRLDACAWGALAALLQGWLAVVRSAPASSADRRGFASLRATGPGDALATRDTAPRGDRIRAAPHIVRATAALVAMAALSMAVWLFVGLPRDDSFVAKFGTFTASGIGMAALCLALSGHSRARPLLARFARWGYPLYLVNMPLLLGFALIGFGQTLSPSSSVLRFAAWVLASIALAALLHYTLERPLLEGGRKRLKPWEAGAASNRPAVKTERDPAG